MMLEAPKKSPQATAASPFRQGLKSRARPSVYLFAFGKKTLLTLVMGFTVAGTLLFVAGLLIGVSVRLPDDLMQVGKADNGAAMVVEAPGDRATTHTQTPSPAMPSNIPDQPSDEPPVEVSLTQEGKVMQAEPSKEEGAQAVLQEPDRTLTPAPTELAEPSEAAESPASPPAPAMAFSVQVGAFLIEKEADNLVEALKRHGYAPSIVRSWGTWNAEKRLWYTVRIGDYESRETATQAAAEFTRKENMPAIVRHSDAL